ncbi:hypothetical protein FB45DRAFT_1058278 [Roridomyces roridus]|uniref:Uncharacterized protein n=1 Tax=Roridomyces roridus TaxID=1738132 RepID=A0AAD7FN85_9AGAR|nr:hypothetical protein FB45DRAFT_1058278 [Roridomyces roridus]
MVRTSPATPPTLTMHSRSSSIPGSPGEKFYEQGAPGGAVYVVTPGGYARRLAVPLTVIFGQLALVAFVFGFLAAIHSRGQILDYRVAELTFLHPQSKTYVVTFVSQLLALFSSSLFTKAVLHLMHVYLAQPVSVANIGFWISLSKKSMVFERREIKWFVGCAIIFLATTSQSASWSSLLTPGTIVISTGLHGNEIDLTSPLFSDEDQFTAIWNATNGIGSYLAGALSSVVSASGATSADAQIGHVSVLDYNGWVHIGTTGGVLPIFYEPNRPTNGLVTSNTGPLPSIGSSFNMSMKQQGLIADVTCQAKQLNANTDPAVNRAVMPVANVTINNATLEYNVVSVSTVCPNGQAIWQDMMSSSPSLDSVAAMSCYSPADSPPNATTYSVIIDGRGKYAYGDGSLVCTVTPKTLDYIVTYTTEGYVYKNLDLEPTDPHVQPAQPWLSYAIARSIEQAFLYAQSGTSGNVIGDTLVMVFDEQQGNLDYADLMEAYLQGVVSFTGTAIKTLLAASNGPWGAQGPPANLKLERPIDGFALTTSVGWQYKEGARNYLMLLPILFIALVSILFVLIAEYQTGFRGMPSGHAGFDPGNPLHLMAAASAGGMSEAFRGLSEEDIEDGKDRRLQLAHVDGRPGFCEVRPTGF